MILRYEVQCRTTLFPVLNRCSVLITPIEDIVTEQKYVRVKLHQLTIELYLSTRSADGSSIVKMRSEVKKRSRWSVCKGNLISPPCPSTR
ncbi:hypothetical protein BOW92_gp088 [Synechococcus phage S-WAM1]|uniref:Uncharacterized protein n=1 Tax=Synechococcus phage S-WAM1 TaxID=1815521 RepID=A0A1D8KSH0_9CAUD|nr:hypothetical protein BOW92_gp088 [Synechococcus phage S-WAM1]AOV61630.1 hypothetical protein P090810_156 [Synechococcus phage S-WAM1]